MTVPKNCKNYLNLCPEAPGEGRENSALSTAHLRGEVTMSPTCTRQYTGERAQYRSPAPDSWYPGQWNSITWNTITLKKKFLDVFKGMEWKEKRVEERQKIKALPMNKVSRRLKFQWPWHLTHPCSSSLIYHIAYVLWKNRSLARFGRTWTPLHWGRKLFALEVIFCFPYSIQSLYFSAERSQHNPGKL